jgi:predicted AAA+ superfamily ATPase
MTDPIARIADALDRIAPSAPAAADPLAHPAYVWRRGQLAAARHFAPLPLNLLRGIDAQKDAVHANLLRLSAGHAAHDVLLWGAKGTGKSALVKSAVADLQAAGKALALIEVPTTALDTLPRLFDVIDGVARGFALFIDDLAFDAVGEARALRSMLEGGAEARPDNARFFVTSNRRHLVTRDMAEQESAINPRDVADDQLALADRFGLSLGFHVLDQEGYLAIVQGYAADIGLPFDAHDAVQWATQRGARSGRIAWHYVVDLAGRHGRSLKST